LDVVELVAIILSVETWPPAADVNEDGIADILDVIVIVEWLPSG